MSNLEQTLSIIKPDAVERNLTEEIKNIFIENNLKLKIVKKYILQKMKLQNFIKFINQNLFIMIYVSYLSSGPIVVMILRAKMPFASYRKIMGATDPKMQKKNTIRELFGISIDKNSVHGSDSNDNAKKEIDFLKIKYVYKF